MSGTARIVVEEGKPIEHPCVWRGDELEACGDWVRELTVEEVDDVVEAAGDRSTPGIYRDDMDTAEFELPSLAPKLRAIRKDLEEGAGAVLIRGLSIDVDTPLPLERIFMGLAAHIGTPVSQGAEGDKLFHVRDSGFKGDDPRARGPNTRKRLSFHTDRCDVIGFLCVNAAKSGGENEIVSSAALYNEVLKRRPDHLEVLMRRFRYHRHTVDTGNPLPYCEQPIFSIYEGHFASNLLRVLIERAYAADGGPRMTPEQKEALDFLEEVAAEPGMHYRFRQEPGDILFLNNWVTYHRRTEFVDFEEEEKRRHLLRVWLSVPNSRPLHPDFAANYGRTEAGAVRGGMKRGGIRK